MNVHSPNEGNRHVVAVWFSWCAADRTNDLGISISYAYDPIGNRTSAAENGTTNIYASNELNQYTSLNPDTTNNTPFAYDSDGNMTSDGIWSYAWDAENRLVEVQPLVTNLDSALVQYMYDAQSRRIARREFAWMPFLHDAPAWRYVQGRAYRYDGWNLLQELKPATTPRTPPTYIPQTDLSLTGIDGVVSAQYVWGLDLSRSIHGGGVGGLLEMATVESEQIEQGFCVYDGNGNMMGIQDTDGRQRVAVEYDAQGKTIVRTNTWAAADLFAFGTKQYESKIGLYWYGYRYSHTGAGRWLSRDWIGESMDVNLYCWVGNQPVSRWDLWGLLSAGKIEGSCNQYIQMRQDKGAWTRIETETLKFDGIDDCNREVNRGFENEYVRTLWNNFLNAKYSRKCRQPQIKCKCCNRWQHSQHPNVVAGLLGQYIEEGNVVYVCWNTRNQSEIWRTMVHELTHALQKCTDNGEITDECELSLMSEIEARVCAGECSDFDDCLSKALLSSCNPDFHCRSGAEVIRVLDVLRQWFISDLQGGKRCRFLEKPVPRRPASPQP